MMITRRKDAKDMRGKCGDTKVQQEFEFGQKLSVRKQTNIQKINDNKDNNKKESNSIPS